VREERGWMVSFVVVGLEYKDAAETAAKIRQGRTPGVCDRTEITTVDAMWIDKENDNDNDDDDELGNTDSQATVACPLPPPSKSGVPLRAKDPE